MYNKWLTLSTRKSNDPEGVRFMFTSPVMISIKTTPKLYTSTFSVRMPRVTYSGATYPLQWPVSPLHKIGSEQAFINIFGEYMSDS
jgi:hypothetical protein